MSKKSKKAPQTRKPAAAGPRSASRPAPGRSRSYPARETAQANLLAVRIVAGVLAALCLAGIVGVLATQAAPYPANIVVEVILLAFITGFCVLTAVRPEGTVRWFSRLGK
jgi:hypothetical protein